ncbi:MAG: transport system permease [Chloroflexi bacterium OLB15]|nr:MAG: transport system permease [Chloroflexi bacterium OLB15]
MSLETVAPKIAAPTRPLTFSRPAKRLFLLGLLVAGAIIIFMTIDSRGNWDFVIPFRGTKILALALVSYAIAVSTVLFQTVAGNRILSPSIMGFDALYVLIQTTLVFVLGAQATVTLNLQARFVLEVTCMVLFAGILYRWLFGGTRRSLHLLILVGIIFGVLFRSFANMMMRLIDPNEFVILQDMLFASFNSFDRNLLWVSAALIFGGSIVLWRIGHTFDILALGRETAVNLGINFQRTVTIILVVIAIFVSVSTALVGPVTFFGLLVANLAYQLAGTYKHRWILPFAAGLALLFLVSGQMVVERLFSFNTSLSIVVEFLGGIVFIILLIRGAGR